MSSISEVNASLVETPSIPKSPVKNMSRISISDLSPPVQSPLPSKKELKASAKVIFAQSCATFLNIFSPNRNEASPIQKQIQEREQLFQGYQEAVRDNFAEINIPEEFPLPETYPGLESFCEASPEMRDQILYFQATLQEFTKSQLSKDLLSQNSAMELRHDLVYLKNLPGYQMLLAKVPDHPAVKFLGILGYLLETPPMMQPLISYGEQKVGAFLPKDQQTVTYQQFGEALRQGQKSFAYSRDNPLATIKWAANNPDRMDQVVSAERDPLNYDSYNNQMAFVVGILIDEEGHRVIHKYTPGLTGPRSIFEEVLLPQYQREGRIAVHIDNQSIHAKDEKERIAAVHRMAEKFPGTFCHAVLSTDSLDHYNKALIARFKEDKSENLTLDAFVEEYIQNIRGEDNRFIRDFAECHGIHISQELLSDSDLEAVFTAVKNMLLEHPERAAFGETYSKAEILDCMRRNLLSTLSWAILKKAQLQSNPNAPTIFTMNCKENIDRGPQENEDMLFNEAMFQHKDEINIVDAHRRAGINLGRADIAMRRPPQSTRLEPLLNRWSFFANEVAFHHGHSELQKLHDTIRINTVPAPVEAAQPQ